MDDKIKLLTESGFSADFIAAYKDYVENVDFKKEEEKQAAQEEDNSISSENIIIENVEAQNIIFTTTE